MAFDMPLEADQPGESRFFLSFVTAPVVGTLMWILGGDSLDEVEKGENLGASNSKNPNSMIVVGNDSSKNECADPKHTALDNDKSKYVTTTSFPSLEESDTSSSDDEGENSYFADDRGSKSQNQNNFDRIRNQCFRKEAKRSRKMSWSDQSGQSLAEYFDETSHHEPISDAQPVKSAMRRSGTLRMNVPTGSHNDLRDATRTSKSNSVQHQFIPSGITGSGGGIIMPSGGGFKATPGGNGNGYVSPQWGWYISTTPPTPEKYSDSNLVRKSIKEKKNNFDHQYATIDEESVTPPKSHAHPNIPVFTKGLKGTGRTHMEWPSIPL